MAEKFKVERGGVLPFPAYVAAGLMAHESLHGAFLVYHRLLVDLQLNLEYQTNDQLAGRVSLSKRSVQRAIGQLETLGLVTVVPVSSNRRKLDVVVEGTDGLRRMLAKLARRKLTVDYKTGQLVEVGDPTDPQSSGVGDPTDPQSSGVGDPTAPRSEGVGDPTDPLGCPHGPAGVTPQHLGQQVKSEQLSAFVDETYAESGKAEPELFKPKSAKSGYIYTSTMSLENTDTSTSTSKKNTARDWRNSEYYPDFVYLFGLWRELSPYAVNWKEDESRFKYVRARRKDGFTVDDLESALRVAAKQPVYNFTKGNVVVDFKHIFKDRVKVEQFLAAASVGPSAPAGKGRVATDAYNADLGASKAKNIGSEF